MPRRAKGVLTEVQRQALRDRFTPLLAQERGRTWEREAANTFGLPSILGSHPLPKGWRWSDLYYYNASYDVVETRLISETREVEIVCTRMQAEDYEQLKYVIHDALHGAHIPCWGRRKPRYRKEIMNAGLKVNKGPSGAKEAEVLGGVPAEDDGPAAGAPLVALPEEPVRAVEAPAIDAGVPQHWAFDGRGAADATGTPYLPDPLPDSIG